MVRSGRRRRLGILVLLTLATASAGGASAVGASSSTTASARAGTSAPPSPAKAVAKVGPVGGTSAYGIPPLPIYPLNAAPPDSLVAYGSKLRSAVTVVDKAKITATITGIDLLGYLQNCLDDPLGAGKAIQTCCPDALDVSTCPAANVVDAPPTTADSPLLSWLRTRGPVWVHNRKNHGSTRFGTFPPLRISLLAFGSIPVTATIDISQPIGAGGLVTPLSFELLSLFGDPPQGLRVAGYPVPNPVDRDYFIQTLTISGPVVLSLRDLKVDKVLVPVGPNCHTQTPAIISFVSPQGWYDSTTAPPLLFGRAGGFQPLNTDGTGSITGNIAVPAFTGCRDQAGSLDPLITAMASSPHNSVHLTLTHAFNDCGGKIKCIPYPTVPTPAPAAVPTPAVSLAAGQLSVLATSLARLPLTVRESTLRALPAALAQAVRPRIR